MKTALHFTIALLSMLALAEARDFGVSTSSKGRGTKIETERGGTAYVGPRGVAAEGAKGNKAAANRYGGAAYSGPNSAGARNRYGGATAVTNDGDVYRRGGGVAAAPVAVAPVRAVAPLPAGYIRTVPAGYTTVVRAGYTCMFVGGVYYRPVIYGGETVYIVVP